MWTKKLSLNVPLAVTRHGTFPYIDCTILTNHLSTSSFLKSHHTKSLGTQSKAVCKSKNAIYKSIFFAKYFSCNCLKIKNNISSPHPDIRPNYISSMSTCCLINFSIILSNIFRIWSVKFSPL